MRVDVVLISRVQFAANAMFHIFFVLFALGLSFLVADMETRYAKTGDQTYLRMTKFRGKPFLIKFAMGVAVRIPLNFSLIPN